MPLTDRTPDDVFTADAQKWSFDGVTASSGVVKIPPTMYSVLTLEGVTVNDHIVVTPGMHFCDTPDEGLFDGIHWTCPDCGKEWQVQVERWWEEINE